MIRVERADTPERRIDLEAGDPFPALEMLAAEVAGARGSVVAILPEREVWRGRVVSAAAARPIAAGALGVAPDRVALRLGRRGADGRRPVAAVSRATLADARAFLARGGLGAARLTAPGGHAGFDAPPDFGGMALADMRIGASGAAAGLAAALALVAWLTPWSDRPAPRAQAPAAVAIDMAALPPAPAGFPDPTAPAQVAQVPAAAPAQAPAPADLALVAPLARPAALDRPAAAVAAAEPRAAKAATPVPARIAAAKPPAARPEVPAVPTPQLALAAPVLAGRNLPADLAPPAAASRTGNLARIAPPPARPAATSAAAAARAAAPRAPGAPLPRPRAVSAAATEAAPAVAAERRAPVVPGAPRPRPAGAAALSAAVLNARIGSALAAAATDLSPRARPDIGGPTATPGAVRVASLAPTPSVLNDFSSVAPATVATVAPPEPRRAAAPAAPQRTAVVPPARAEAAPRAPVAATKPVAQTAPRPVPVVRAAPAPVRAAPAPVRVARLDPAPQPVLRAAPAQPKAQAAVRVAPAPAKPVVQAPPQVVRTQPAALQKTARFQQPAAPGVRAAAAQPAKPAAQRQAAATAKPQRQAAAAERRPTRKPAPQQAREIRGGASKLALIGVFGGSGGRHALVQLPNGATERVKAGDSFGGVQVTAITGSTVHLRSRGRDSVLTLPE